MQTSRNLGSAQWKTAANRGIRVGLTTSSNGHKEGLPGDFARSSTTRSTCKLQSSLAVATMCVQYCAHTATYIRWSNRDVPNSINRSRVCSRSISFQRLRGRVSILEAYVASLQPAKDRYGRDLKEHPSLDDNGDGVGHFGGLPSGGDGSAAKKRFLGDQGRSLQFEESAIEQLRQANSTMLLK